MSENKIKLELEARAENVAIARVTAAAFIAPFDPTVGEMTDIKTAVSEAVTNAIIHGYGEAQMTLPRNARPPQRSEEAERGSSSRSGGGLGAAPPLVCMTLSSSERVITIEISDSGVGIENIETAREPLFTTKPEMERSGLGFTVMESFMDSVEIKSAPGAGTTITMRKELGEHSN